MDYLARVRKFSDKDVKISDEIKVETKETVFKGMLMPNPSSDGLILKLGNGYNRFINFNEIKEIILIRKGKGVGNIPTSKKILRKGLPKISMISTGGTIGTHVDYKTGGVFMCRTPEQIITAVPEIRGIINIARMVSPFTTASEDLTPKHWDKIGEIVLKELNDDEIRGVIITMGTDTMHYFSAALSFMLQNLNKPVAIVGAQRSPDRGSFDGSMNLLCAAHYCKSNIAEVATIMHGSNQDDYCLAIRGTKVRKMHSSRRDAFRPINDLPLAKIWPEGKLEITNDKHSKRRVGKTVLKKGFSQAGLIKAYPGSDPSIINWFIKQGYKGVVIEGTGLGHVPTGESGSESKLFDKKKSWVPYVKKAVKKGMVVAITTQTIYGRVNPFVYRNLRLLHEAGAVFCEDMHPETALVKLSWLLSNHPEHVKELLGKNLVGEINEKMSSTAFLI